MSIEPNSLQGMLAIARLKQLGAAVVPEIHDQRVLRPKLLAEGKVLFARANEYICLKCERTFPLSYGPDNCPCGAPLMRAKKPVTQEEADAMPPGTEFEPITLPPGSVRPGP